MRRLPRGVLGIALGAASAAWGVRAMAQDTTAVGRCAKPDSIGVTGSVRVPEASIRSDFGVAAGSQLNTRAVQDGVKALFATGQFDDVQVLCTVDGQGRATLVVQVKERPVLGAVSVVGAKRISEKTIREHIG